MRESTPIDDKSQSGGSASEKTIESGKQGSKVDELYQKARPLADDPRILDRLTEVLGELGVTGEERLTKLLYLTITSRVLEKPSSSMVNGPSSAGKSFVLEQVLKLFPEKAYVWRTSVSPKALAYSQESYKHRTIIISEAVGFNNYEGAFFMRTLLSENRISHETVVEGEGRTFRKEGPTNLISTTTALAVESELQNRILMLSANDTANQTRSIMDTYADRVATGKSYRLPNLAPWVALQELISTQIKARVVVPFMPALVRLIPPVAVRLRRDIPQITALIQTHALLHAATRRNADDGAVIAVLDDYEAIYELVEDVFSEGVDRTVPLDVRETVEAVNRLQAKHELKSVPQKMLVEALELDKSAVSRRVTKAVRLGFLEKAAGSSNKENTLKPATPLSVDAGLLPTPNEVRRAMKNDQQEAKE
ncbi:hypothetical protein [Nitratireductor luteus]|uniref:hypothetical protein n=1 Tax=Nitratireductor luteus TaxID=2976980 RepID=UPI00223F9067|nr:hypothetical protein [Nitratireductor luteus]